MNSPQFGAIPDCTWNNLLIVLSLHSITSTLEVLTVPSLAVVETVFVFKSQTGSAA